MFNLPWGRTFCFNRNYRFLCYTLSRRQLQLLLLVSSETVAVVLPLRLHRPLAFLALSLWFTSPGSYRKTSAVACFSTISSRQTRIMRLVPQPPISYRDNDGTDEITNKKKLLDLTSLSETILLTESRRQKAYDLSRKMQVSIRKAYHEVMERDVIVLLNSFIENEENGELIGPVADRKPRLANLSMSMEDIAQLMAFQAFLKTGRLLEPMTCFTDEEYLAGSCMGLTQDLARYALGRATVRDFGSVLAAKQVVSECLQFLLQLDFRNGSLRRKYDGVKYTLKTLETLAYELSITGSDLDSIPVFKKARTEAFSPEFIPIEQLLALKDRMDHRDNLRETLIKKCRDGQKASKQAIFALHRGDKSQSLRLLSQCLQCIHDDLLPIVQEEPQLRYGAFASVLEEYVEARLFSTWLYGIHPEDDTPLAATPSGILLQPHQMDVELEAEEYIGGLCDLTGEIGRFAVQRGTARDFDGVKCCLLTNADILASLETLDRLPGGNSLEKKLDTVRKSVEKIERMLYEMSLSEAAGGRNVETDVMDLELREDE